MSTEKPVFEDPFDYSADNSDEETNVSTGIKSIQQIMHRLSNAETRRSSLTTNLKLVRDLITNLISIEEKRLSEYDPFSVTGRMSTPYPTENKPKKIKSKELKESISKKLEIVEPVDKDPPVDLVDSEVQTDVTKIAQKKLEKLSNEEGVTLIDDIIGSVITLIPDEVMSSKTVVTKPLGQTSGVEEDAVVSVIGLIPDEVRGSQTSGFDEDAAAKIDTIELDEDVGSACPPNRRLRAWQRTFNARRRIAAHIMSRTGKRADDILFNRNTRAEEQEKQLQIMDCAQHMSPTKTNKKSTRLHEIMNEHKQFIREMEAAIPKKKIRPLPELLRRKLMEANLCDSKSNIRWIRANMLEKRILAKETGMRGYIECCPNSSCLSILGSKKPISMQYYGDHTTRCYETRETRTTCYYGVSPCQDGCCRPRWEY